ncbi:MAG: hypothetical protein AAF355_04885 [Myxococcota bacterium]
MEGDAQVTDGSGTQIDASEVSSEQSCSDGLRNGDETSIDCGGSCQPCMSGLRCNIGSDCTSAVCELRGLMGVCLVATCQDGVLNGGETSLDCGGNCTQCPNGSLCVNHWDCRSGQCLSGVCNDPSCVDGSQNGYETDVDCGGGLCPKCPAGERCTEDDDCATSSCGFMFCLEATCDDLIQNQDETSTDCGGVTCDPCGSGLACLVDGDCLSGSCLAGGCGSCGDGLQTGDESDVDCGGQQCERCLVDERCVEDGDCESDYCLAGLCSSGNCSDGSRNNRETDIDCGGPACGATCSIGNDCIRDQDCISLRCVDGFCDSCSAPTDCADFNCSAGACVAATCMDAIQNGNEGDVDCGGSECASCALGASCNAPDDCQSLNCSGGICGSPSCTDGRQNGEETDIDCGGSCGGCSDFLHCSLDSDCDGSCYSGICIGSTCSEFSTTDTFGYVGCQATLPVDELPCPDPAVSGTRLNLSDNGQMEVDLGFRFRFYGTVYQTVSIEDNGALMFTGNSIARFNQCLPSGSYSNFIAPLWDDWVTSGALHYETFGTAPNRKFAVRFEPQTFFVSNRADFTVVLNETSNHIEFCYVDTTVNVSSFDGGRSATIGIQGESSGEHVEFSCDTPSIGPGSYIRFVLP